MVSPAGASILSLLPRKGARVDVLNTTINAAVVAVVGILLGGYLKGRFDAVDRRFEQMDRRFEMVDRRFEMVEARLSSIEARLEAHDTRFEALEARMESLERSLDGVRSDLTRVALAVAGPASEAGGSR